jgi:hypothetical protein
MSLADKTKEALADEVDLDELLGLKDWRPSEHSARENAEQYVGYDQAKAQVYATLAMADEIDNLVCTLSDIAHDAPINLGKVLTQVFG